MPLKTFTVHLDFKSSSYVVPMPRFHNIHDLKLTCENQNTGDSLIDKIQQKLLIYWISTKPTKIRPNFRK